MARACLFQVHLALELTRNEGTKKRPLVLRFEEGRACRDGKIKKAVQGDWVPALIGQMTGVEGPVPCAVAGLRSLSVSPYDQMGYWLLAIGLVAGITYR